MTNTPKPQANKTIRELLKKYFTGEQVDPLFGTMIRIPFTKQMDEATQAITQAMLDIPELQSEWEEDIHGTPNPNGKARNELRAEIRTAIKKIGGNYDQTPN